MGNAAEYEQAQVRLNQAEDSQAREGRDNISGAYLDLHKALYLFRDPSKVALQVYYDLAKAGVWNKVSLQSISNTWLEMLNKADKGEPMSQEDMGRSMIGIIKGVQSGPNAPAGQVSPPLDTFSNAESQDRLGRAYALGDGVPKNTAEAMKWFRKAAEQGNADAQSWVGVAYFLGDGVPKNTAEAVQWFRKAAEQGNADGQYGLGRAYFEGEGVPKDPAEGVTWFRKAAEQGNVHGQYDLGGAYLAGIGVPKETTETVKWWSKAAKQGHAEAQHNLGVMYAKGIGISKDDVEAYMWLSLAVAKGEQGANEMLNSVTKEMTADQIAEAQRRSREWKPTSETQN